jgi:hypothetical protein
VYEPLAARFSAERVFLDNQSIGLGAAYPERMRTVLRSMRVLLALIWPRWLSSGGADDQRLLIERDDDWVRYEIRQAVRRGIPIVPVLLDGASLPPAERLPGDIRDLVLHQAVRVRHESLGHDIERLADGLVRLVPVLAGLPPRHPLRHPLRQVVTPSLVARQLPPAARTFVGRVAERAELDAVLRSAAESTAIVAVDGTAGVGKTCLAVWWAHRAQDAFPDGTLFADLGGHGPGTPITPAVALSSFVQALGLPENRVPTGEDALISTYRSLLSGRHVLVVLPAGAQPDRAARAPSVVEGHRAARTAPRGCGPPQDHANARPEHPSSGDAGKHQVRDLSRVLGTHSPGSARTGRWRQGPEPRPCRFARRGRPCRTKLRFAFSVTATIGNWLIDGSATSLIPGGGQPMVLLAEVLRATVVDGSVLARDGNQHLFIERSP